MRKHL
jgi:hypothetical protein